MNAADVCDCDGLRARAEQAEARVDELDAEVAELRAIFQRIAAACADRGASL